MPNLDDFDIDQLKNTWQNQKVEDAYAQSDIEAMLNKKSKSYVKYILWVSIAEFIIFGVVNILRFFSRGNESEFETILSKLNLHNEQEIILSMDRYYYIIKLTSLLLTGVFVILFYKGYKKINVESNMKNFIQQIFKFKKSVNAFITCNVVLLILFLASFGIYLSIVMKQQNEHVSGSSMIGILTGTVVALLLTVVLILFYYRLVYGILLKRLSKTMTQLKQLEAEKEL
ncbi:beta-carotene 15,15'-monooxygenase [Chryseobacterium sp. T1]